MPRWHPLATTLGVATLSTLLGGCEQAAPAGLDEDHRGRPAAPTTSVIASTEGADVMIHACYIPGSGMIYRISADGVEGLKEDCNAKKHIEFSWPAGLAFAGQTCPPGEFVYGFDASGQRPHRPHRPRLPRHPR